MAIITVSRQLGSLGRNASQKVYQKHRDRVLPLRSLSALQPIVAGQRP